ncbi:HAD-IIB family hydrolase [Dehalococcoides mccartyi]|nr:HAD-IIB family hydrolase [Dehalococcoides mccartyi]
MTNKEVTDELTNRRIPAGLLLDLDGTVLPENNQPTARVKEAIAAASRIIPVGVASGRAQDEVCHFARLFGLDTPQVADNGAVLIDPVTGRVIKRRTFDRQTAEQVISEFKDASSKIIICDAGRFIVDPAEIKDWQITIIMAKFDTEAETREWVGRFPEESVSSYATSDNLGDWYIDCTAAGVSKATGAKDFASAVGIDPSELMVIGDGSNDVPMFEVAGTSIAMEGGDKKLLEIATAVTPNLDNDGAAIAIEKYILNR